MAAVGEEMLDHQPLMVLLEDQVVEVLQMVMLVEQEIVHQQHHHKIAVHAMAIIGMRQMVNAMRVSTTVVHPSAE